MRRLRRKQPTFTIGDVCKALDVPRNTVSSWAHNGWFDLLDAAETAPRQPRRFTVADLYRLAILRTMTIYGGMDALLTRPLMEHALRLMERYGRHITEASILVYRDGSPEFRVNEDLYKEPPKPGVLLRVTVGLAEIDKMMKERLGLTITEALPSTVKQVAEHNDG